MKCLERGNHRTRKRGGAELETLHELKDIYVFDTVIRVDSSVEWAQDNSAPVVEYKKSSRSAKEYTELAEEVIKHVTW